MSAFPPLSLAGGLRYGETSPSFPLSLRPRFFFGWGSFFTFLLHHRFVGSLRVQRFEPLAALCSFSVSEDGVRSSPLHTHSEHRPSSPEDSGVFLMLMPVLSLVTGEADDGFS